MSARQRAGAAVRGNDHMSKERKEYYADPLAIPPECNQLCRFRQCYNKYEDKGSFTPGVGYTGYYDDFRPVCATRMMNGCPDWRDTPDDRYSQDKVFSELLAVLTIVLDAGRKTAAQRRRISAAKKMLEDIMALSAGR